MSRITAGAVNALRQGATACATMPLVLVIVCYYFRRTRKSNTKDLSVASWVPFNCNRRPGSQVVRPRPDSVKLPIVFPSPPNNISLLTLSCPLYPSSPATLTPINNGKWMLEGVPARFQADKKGVLQQKCHTRERLQSRLQWKQRERERERLTLRWAPVATLILTICIISLRGVSIQRWHSPDPLHPPNSSCHSSSGFRGPFGILSLPHPPTNLSPRSYRRKAQRCSAPDKSVTLSRWRREEWGKQ